MCWAEPRPSGLPPVSKPAAPAGLVHLATVELERPLPAPLAYARVFAGVFDAIVSRAGSRWRRGRAAVAAGARGAGVHGAQGPADAGLSTSAPRCWRIGGRSWMTTSGARSAHPGGAAAYLREKNPLWRMVGRVTFHLAENKRDDSHPFAFMASYTSRLSSQGRAQHLPLARAAGICGGEEPGRAPRAVDADQPGGRRSGLGKGNSRERRHL